MFSKSCEYSIRALLYIYKNTLDGSKINIEEVSGAIGTPRYFTGKLLQTLAKQKIISSLKGPNGGFYIALDGPDIQLSKVVEAIDGPEIFKACALGLSACSEDHPCPLHQHYKGIREQIKAMMENQTIQQLGEKLEKEKVFIKDENN
ncbi:MAG: RrF2 family transcriptional regulator [Chitinophagaceae bacterium]